LQICEIVLLELNGEVEGIKKIFPRLIKWIIGVGNYFFTPKYKEM